MPIYPDGIQSFAKIRENGWVYVDKTAVVHEMIPNPEIRKGLFNSLLPYYVDTRSANDGRVIIDDMRDLLDEDDINTTHYPTK